MPLAVDAVLFDLDDTLCVYERSVSEMLAIAFDCAGVEPFFDADAYRARFDQFLDEHDDVDALRERCFVDIAEDRGRDPELARAVAEAYAAARDPAGVEPRPGAPETVRRLADQYPVGLITNGGADLQRAKLERIGLADAFDAVVFAGEDTAAKPEPEPFERGLAALDVAPERAVHVGNSLRSDVAGADALGIGSVWTPTDEDLPEDVDDPGAVESGHPDVEPFPDAVLSSLEELPALLDGAVTRE